MLLALVTAILTATSTTGRTDTTFEARPGTRLSVNNFGGEIAISSWGKNAVKIGAEHSERSRILISRSGPNIDVRAVSRHGAPARVDYVIVVPEWMPLILQGIYTNIAVKGIKSDVSAETVKGDVDVQGGDGLVRASSVEGSVFVDGARGRIELNAVNEGVDVVDAKGEIVVNAINGDINLEAVESAMVEASTVNGTVRYLGDVRDGGRYSFSTHNGDLVFGVPDRANATVQVATFNGDFESAFPVQLERTRRGRRFNFTLGNGSALVNLESFEGTIHLRRPLELGEKLRIKQIRMLRELKELKAMKERLREAREDRSRDDKDGDEP